MVVLPCAVYCFLWYIFNFSMYILDQILSIHGKNNVGDLF